MKCKIPKNPYNKRGTRLTRFNKTFVSTFTYNVLYYRQGIVKPFYNKTGASLSNFMNFSNFMNIIYE